jgi:predicted transcriptional regulator
LAKIENLILAALEELEAGLTLKEIAEKIGESEKKVFKALRKLFEKGAIESKNRRYKLTNL